MLLYEYLINTLPAASVACSLLLRVLDGSLNNVVITFIRAGEGCGCGCGVVVGVLLAVVAESKRSENKQVQPR